MPKLSLLAAACLAWAAAAAQAEPADCASAASDACFRSFVPPGAGGSLHYYASLSDEPAAQAGPTWALVALHGHSRDANKTFDAALQAVRGGPASDRTLVVAPLFQVAADRAGKCSTAGVPAAQGDDLLWTCASWPEGGRARNGSGITSFAALDALVAELSARWPSLRSITIAGFSAGGQMVQHYIGFARTDAARPPALHYVVADPGTWLYFDPVRPQPVRDGTPVEWSACGSGADRFGACTPVFSSGSDGSCPELNRWKYGTDDLPADLNRTAAEARRRYAEADIRYLEGELDDSAARGTAYRVLDRSCAAQAQGPYRLQRGLAYAAYDRTLLAPERQRQLVVVPGCAHDVACVFPAEAARAALLGGR
jgi:hypothetical protein